MDDLEARVVSPAPVLVLTWLKGLCQRENPCVADVGVCAAKREQTSRLLNQSNARRLALRGTQALEDCYRIRKNGEHARKITSFSKVVLKANVPSLFLRGFSALATAFSVLLPIDISAGAF